MMTLRSLRSPAASTCSMVDFMESKATERNPERASTWGWWSFTASTKALFGLVDTQVVDLEAVHLQHEAHDVFADVVDVAPHRA